MVTCSTARDPQHVSNRPSGDATAKPLATVVGSGSGGQVSSATGIWRASHVSFGSNGKNVPLEIRVTLVPRGIRLEIPEVLKLPGGKTLDLLPIDARTYRATDSTGHVTTFRVLGPQRADFTVTGAGGTGPVTFQLDQHAPL
jgi:hypothetical protein